MGFVKELSVWCYNVTNPNKCHSFKPLDCQGIPKKGDFVRRRSAIDQGI